MLFDLSNEYDVPRFREYCEKLIGGRAFVELKRKEERRTLSQNSYLHLILGYFASEYGCTLDEVKVDFFKRECNRELFEREAVTRRGVHVKVLRSSADLTKDEMTTAITRFRNWSSMVAGIYLPSPEDREYLKYCMRAVEGAREYI